VKRVCEAQAKNTDIVTRCGPGLASLRYQCALSIIHQALYLSVKHDARAGRIFQSGSNWFVSNMTQKFILEARHTGLLRGSPRIAALPSKFMGLRGWPRWRGSSIGSSPDHLHVVFGILVVDAHERVGRSDDDLAAELDTRSV